MTLVAGVGAALLKDFEEGPPTAQPTTTVTATFTDTPTPTDTATDLPTDEPTGEPTDEPTDEPTVEPTETQEPEVPPLPRSGVPVGAFGFVLLLVGAAIARWQHAAGY